MTLASVRACRAAALSAARPHRQKGMICAKAVVARRWNSGFRDRDPARESALPASTQPTSTSPASASLPSPPQNSTPLADRLAELTATLAATAGTVSQQINRFTGTDYSPIAVLRAEISSTEQLVKTRRAVVTTAKFDLDSALAMQAAAQKEVVGLLERKPSWAGADLDRYMALVRSEHVNEQAVAAAKQAVAAADSALDAARARLDRLERQQYHDEQVWSDTIRRNSTWVTIGLMGANVAVLLASVLLIEPWRRHRLVRDIHSALDDNVAQTVAATREIVADQSVASLASRMDVDVIDRLADDIGREVEPAVSEDVDDAVGLTKSVMPDEMVQHAESAPVDATTDATTSQSTQSQPESAAVSVPVETVPSPQPASPLPSPPLQSAILQSVPPVPGWMQSHLPARAVQTVEAGIESVYVAADRLLASDRTRPVRPIDQTVLALEAAVVGGLAVVIGNFVINR